MKSDIRQTVIADALGITSAAVSQFVHGTALPKSVQLAEILALLNIVDNRRVLIQQMLFEARKEASLCGELVEIDEGDKFFPEDGEELEDAKYWTGCDIKDWDENSIYAGKENTPPATEKIVNIDNSTEEANNQHKEDIIEEFAGKFTEEDDDEEENENDEDNDGDEEDDEDEEKNSINLDEIYNETYGSNIFFSQPAMGVPVIKLDDLRNFDQGMNLEDFAFNCSHDIMIRDYGSMCGYPIVVQATGDMLGLRYFGLVQLVITNTTPTRKTLFELKYYKRGDYFRLLPIDDGSNVLHGLESMFDSRNFPKIKSTWMMYVLEFTVFPFSAQALAMDDGEWL